MTNNPINYVDPSGLQNSPYGAGVETALDAFSSSLCRNFLRRGGGFGNRDPRDVLDSYVQQGFLAVADKFPTKREVNGSIKTKRFRSGVGAVTSLGFRGGLNLGGVRPISAPYITIAANGFYFTLKTLDGTDVETLEEFSGLSDSEIRGSVILHELAHAFRSIPPDGTNSRLSRANSLNIKRMCFSRLSRLFRDREEPVESPSPTIGTEISPRPFETMSFPGWQADWSFFMLDLLSILANHYDTRSERRRVIF